MSVRDTPNFSPKDQTTARQDMKRLLEEYASSEGSEMSSVPATPSESIAAPTTAPRPKLKIKLRMRKTSASEAPGSSIDSPTPVRGAFKAINRVKHELQADTESSSLSKKDLGISAPKSVKTKSNSNEASFKKEDGTGDDVGENDGDAEHHPQAAQPPTSAAVVPWECGNPRDCDTGQTLDKRDGPAGYGRKVVSHFLGRNKQSTNRIPSGEHDDVWVYWCRKCYQRETYRCNNEEKKGNHAFKCNWYIERLREQVERIQTHRPDALFEITVTKRSKARQADYHKLIAQDKKSEKQALATMAKNITKNKKTGEETPTPEELFPLDLAKDFSQFEGEDKTYDDLEAVMVWIEGHIASGKLEHMPPIEFLLSDIRTGEERVSDATKCKALTKRRVEGGEDIFDEGESGLATPEDENISAKNEGSNAGKVVSEQSPAAAVTPTRSVMPATPLTGHGQTDKAGLDILAAAAAASTAAFAPPSPPATGPKRKSHESSEDSDNGSSKRHRT